MIQKQIKPIVIKILKRISNNKTLGFSIYLLRLITFFIKNVVHIIFI